MASAPTTDSTKDSITAAEIQRLGKALQNQKFRDLLLEYAQELSDPANQAKYEADVIAVERERGYHVTFVRPEPHYVFKTTVSFKDSSDAETKAFVNVCRSDAIEKPSCKRVSPAIARSFYNQESGLLWTVPHSLTYPRDDTDKQCSKCVVYDCVFHPDTLRLAGSNKHFKKMVEEIALDAVENSFGVQLDRAHLKYPKMKFKGTPVATILREKIAPETATMSAESNCTENPEQRPVGANLLKCDIGQTPPSVSDSNGNSETGQRHCTESSLSSAIPKPVSIAAMATIVPKYVIKHRHRSELKDHALVLGVTASALLKPAELVIEVSLPAVDTISSVSLDVVSEKLTLTSLPGMLPHYTLELNLPYRVDDANGRAKFCTETRVLTVELPVLGAESGALLDGDREDASETLCKQISELEIADGCSPVDYRSDPEMNADDAYKVWTDVALSLPEFTCHQGNNELVLVFKVSNVIKDSVLTVCSEGGRKCHLTFISLDEGACSFHYSLVLLFPGECLVVGGAEQVSVTVENTVVTLAKHEDSKHCWEGFDYGVNENMVTFREVFALNALQRKLHVLQNEFAVTAEALQCLSQNPSPVSITEVSSERFTFEVNEADSKSICSLSNGTSPNNEGPDCNKTGNQNDIDHCCPNLALPQNQQTPSDLATSGPNANIDHNSKSIVEVNVSKTVVRPLRKFRSVSESFDDRSPACHPRSILKMHHRSRHLSESSDDACWSSQEYTATVDSDIPEEGSLESLFHVRKSVHFNDKIYRSFFRANSSILGQRKKNQRKDRKKREALRKSSESECSEAENDNKAVSTQPLPNKSKQNVNTNQNQTQQVLATGNWDCQTAYELFCCENNRNEIDTLIKLDNYHKVVTSKAIQVANANGITKKDKARRRKKHLSRKYSDGEGTSSSDGQLPSIEMPIGQKHRYVDIY